MILNVLLVDDEALARSRLRALLGECTSPRITLGGEAANAVQAVELLRRYAFDAVLLDINMPGTDGLTLARTLRSLPQPPALVFVTAHAEHAVTAFELEAVDYLTKPVRLERLQTALQKVERIVTAREGVQPDFLKDFLIIQDRGRTERVPLAEVVYLKAELKYVTVRTATHSYVIDDSLSELEERHAPRFLRIHRNALVARHAVRALEKHFDPEEGEGWAVRLNGVEEVLAVSRRQLPAVRDTIAGAGA
ncbi:MAG: LytTR family DNA-binding domain-containing protein [Rhodoferax sp.]|nr:LytTR family DNA-binding domain-containing protein [Rhodoferax sp.]